MNVSDIKEILTSASSNAIQNNSHRSEWTRKIKESFYLFSKKQGYDVCTSGIEADWGEWLYDLVVLNYDRDHKFIKETILVLESEWDSDETSILEDFQKLLLSNSKYKVMVYCKNQEIIETMKSMISKYKNCTGVFIFAHLASDNENFEYFIVDVQ